MLTMKEGSKHNLFQISQKCLCTNIVNHKRHSKNVGLSKCIWSLKGAALSRNVKYLIECSRKATSKILIIFCLWRPAGEQHLK